MSFDEVEPVLAQVRGPRVRGNPFATAAAQALLARARELDPAGQAAILAALTPGLAVDDPLQAGVVALLCGTIVEWGADPQVAGAAIVERLGRAADTDQLNPEALRYLGLAAMAHLCRDVALRQRARADSPLRAALDRSADAAAEVDFVLQVLNFVDDLELLVLAPDQRRGYLARAQAVHTNFHLFTLLQGALIGDPAAGWLTGRPLDPELLAVATGEAPHERLHQDEQRFHFHHLGAVEPGGAVRFDLGSTIWGEASPREIPLHRGRAVVILGPPILGGRSWDSNFFANIHDALRSRVEVLAQLGPREVDEALANLAGAR